MVEINNQRKAFLDMLAWSEGLITDVRKPENATIWTSLWRRALSDYPDHPRKLVTLNPNSNQQAGRYQLLSRWWMPPQAAWPERLLSEMGRCGIAAD